MRQNDHQKQAEPSGVSPEGKDRETVYDNGLETGIPLFLQRFAGSTSSLPERSEGNTGLNPGPELSQAPPSVIQRYPDDELDAGAGESEDPLPGGVFREGTPEYELNQFMSRLYTTETDYPEGFRPGSGRGAFNAVYDPVGGRLNITVNILFQFRGPVSRFSGDPGYEWQPHEEEAFRRNACRIIEEAWSGQYRFHCTREFWEELPDVDVIAGINPVSSEEGAHYNFIINKYPERCLGEDNAAGARYFDSEEGTVRDLNMRESMHGGIENPDYLERFYDPAFPQFEEVELTNPGQVYFETGRDDLTAESQESLDRFAGVLGQNDIPLFPVEVTGFSTISEGQEHTGLSDQRAEEVVSVISMARTPSLCEAHGVDGAGEGTQWRTAEIDVQPFGFTQTALLHEFGHLVGLGDEYPAGAPGPDQGEEATHSNLAETLIPGQEPVVAYHSGSMMSIGEVVQPWHYVTFLEALGVITDTEGEWEVGPGPGATEVLEESGSQE